jgi:quercetin dioxygenase-like cupin family protein
VAPEPELCSPSEEFLKGYGYAVIAGPGGLVPARIAVGVLLLAPGLLYPAHAHPAEEIYLVLDGASRWWRAGEEWRTEQAGAAIHHSSQLGHAMRAGEAPLCALYLWRGDLATDAKLTGQPRGPASGQASERPHTQKPGS